MDDCPACGAPGTVPSARLEPLPFRECRGCGLAFRADLGRGAARAIYEEGAYERERTRMYAGAETEDRRREAAARVAFLARRVGGPRRLLDIGAAGGHFVRAAADAGWRAGGIEPAPGFAAHARDALGVDVREGTLEDADLDGVEVATMWHVLEHVARPCAALRRLRAAMVEDGALVLEVPNAGSAPARGLGTRWAMLEPEVHVNQFSGAALCALLERAGFAVEHLEDLDAAAYQPLRRRLSAGHLAHVAKWRWRGERELLRAVARPRAPGPAAAVAPA